jgi:hypothetical protein
MFGLETGCSTSVMMLNVHRIRLYLPAAVYGIFLWVKSQDISAGWHWRIESATAIEQIQN